MRAYRWVMEYETGDGCTHTCTHAVPLRSPWTDPISIGVAFLLECEKAYASGDPFVFGGVEFDAEQFYQHAGTAFRTYVEPRFYSVRQWFEKSQVQTP